MITLIIITASPTSPHHLITDPVVDPNEKALVEFYKVVDPTKASIQQVRNTLKKYKGRLAQVFFNLTAVFVTQLRFFFGPDSGFC